jgi:uncharacterized membrane protein (UPF0136 family)
MMVNCGSIDVINTVLCFAILILGILGYVKRRYRLSLAIGVAFGLFGVSHIITILGLHGCLTDLLVAIRVVAYLIVAFTLYRVLVKR